MTSEVDGLSVIAHELKSPWALMRQLALSLDFTDPNPASLARTQDQMVAVSERALQQVQDLTKVARLEDGLFAMEPVAVRSVCDEVSRELAQLFRDYHRQLDLRYSNKARLVVANRELLRSVIYNFASNALHYSERGTVSQLSVRDSHHHVRIDIRDHGPALPTTVWRQLQSGSVTTPTDIAMRPGSSGLGLYIASRFSQYMHARVGAIRHRDGTSFFIELPVSQQIPLF